MPVQVICKIGNIGRIEKDYNIDLLAEPFLKFVYKDSPSNRIASQFKEIIMQTDLLYA
jgi:hypothetical protein